MRGSEREQIQAFNKGFELYKRGKFTDALELFRKSVAADSVANLTTTDPLYLSFYGITLVRTRKNPRLGLKLCKMALKKDDNQQPELYLNLGLAFEKCGKTKKAADTFRKGYRLHPKHPQLLANLQRVSPRRTAPLPFLNRNHFLNKFLGKFLYKSRSSKS